MYGCISGKCLSEGKIVVTNVEGLRKPGVGFVSGLLTVELDHNRRNALRQRLAQKGESGAVIFGFHKTKQRRFAVSLVFFDKILQHALTATLVKCFHVSQCVQFSLMPSNISRN